MLGRLRLAGEDSFRSAYYRWGYGRSFPGKSWIEARVDALDTRTGRGDVPKPQDAWNAQYAAGGWAFLSGVEELAHYSVIVGYASWFRPGGTVLDVGCGAGVLHDRFLTVGYRSYIGVDISDVAVQALRDRALPDTEFHATDAETFTPTADVDVLVFNESLAYFTDPGEQFDRYVEHLADDGVAIVSCHLQSPRAAAVIRDLEDRWTTLDATEVRHGATSWRVAVFAGTRRG